MPTHHRVLTVTLNPAVDQIYAEEFHSCAGGKGINVSRTLRILGMSSLVTGFIGGSTGQEIKTRLRSEKIPFVFEEIKGINRVNVTKIDLGPKFITRILEKGPRIESK